MELKLHFGPQHRLEILNQLVAETKGRIFSATFTKKDGSSRNIVARLGVRRDQKGGESTLAKYENYVTVFDMHKQGYRALNLETLERITCGSKSYVIKTDDTGALSIRQFDLEDNRAFTRE